MKHPLEVRERLEDVERASLSTWATLASETKGRDRYEDPDPLRTAFQQDRSRLHATDTYARLAAKSHRFVPEVVGDAWRSRLSHTLATVELARTMARALRLNEDLAEAIAAGQALGAPPLGEAGCEALAEVLGHRFDIAEQSLRVVEHLEGGLNLTWEVRDGILHQAGTPPAATLEGCTAALARRLAAALFDLRAALRAGWVHLDDLPAIVRSVLGTCHRERVATVVADAAKVSAERPEIGLGTRVEEAVGALEGFLGDAVHGSAAARSEHDRALHCLRSIAIYADAGGRGGSDPADRVGRIADWLCASTDQEVLAAFGDAFSPARTAGGPRPAR